MGNGEGRNNVQGQESETCKQIPARCINAKKKIPIDVKKISCKPGRVGKKVKHKSPHPLPPTPTSLQTPWRIIMQ